MGFRTRKNSGHLADLCQMKAGNPLDEYAGLSWKGGSLHPRGICTGEMDGDGDGRMHIWPTTRRLVIRPHRRRGRAVHMPDACDKTVQQTASCMRIKLAFHLDANVASVQASGCDLGLCRWGGSEMSTTSNPIPWSLGLSSCTSASRRRGKEGLSCVCDVRPVAALEGAKGQHCRHAENG